MCGFAGEICRAEGADADAVEAMATVLASRGPDGRGAWAMDGIALAHRRLKIIDLSEFGQQPMADPDLQRAVVFNGCIYNYKELRRELEGEGYEFFSTSDTEVLLKAHHRWGPDFVRRLYGMFAFALVETDSGRVTLGRDRLGIKPLYFSEGKSRLRFASTPQALIAGGGVDTSIDPVALHHYLTWHAVVPAPRTVLAGVRKLEPATLMTIEPDGKRHSRRYWSPEFSRQPAHADWDENDWRDAIEESLRVAVDRRMVADVPVGVLLSGGLDSSLIVALLAQAGQRGLQTFSVGFEPVGDREGDEFRYSDVVAEEFVTEHHRFLVSADRMLPALDGAIAAMNEPMVSHDNVAFYLLSEEVSRHLKVVQSGQGADEIFAGYHWYATVADGAQGEGFETYEGAFFDGSHDDVAATVRPEHLADGDPSRGFAADHFARKGAADPVDRALRLDTEVMLVDDPVKRLDSMTMAWGLEARVPFLDHELVELAAACPPELKLAQGGKGVLKDIGRRLLPIEVVDRPKGYFPVPALSHLEGGFLDLVRDALLSRAARDRGLFRPEEVKRLIDAPNEHMTRLDGNRLWQLGLVELWLQGLPSPRNSSASDSIRCGRSPTRRSTAS
jgi:asparagine synthase (glutamine-hydrolysing)